MPEQESKHHPQVMASFVGTILCTVDVNKTSVTARLLAALMSVWIKIRANAENLL